MEPSDHIEKAATMLSEARYLVAGGFYDGAGRDAYLAGLHSALAYITFHTGREPKTHSGARTEFSRLTRDDATILPEFRAFLARGYEMKSWADYDRSEPLTLQEAQLAIDDAYRMMEAIAELLRAPKGGALRS